VSNPFAGRLDELRQQGDVAPAQPAAKPRRRSAGKSPEDRLIGCPVWWLQLVLPVVATKEQLVVAIYLWRRRIVCAREPFDVPNGELRAWGVSRRSKYPTLGRMAAAGLIKVAQRSAKTAPQVTILAEKPRRK
jgi:hypothetical protein